MQTIIDLSLRHCPCLKYLKEDDHEASGENEAPSAAQISQKQISYVENLEKEDDAADLDAMISNLQYRLGELAKIFNEVSNL